MSLLEVRNVKKVYSSRFSTNSVQALRNVNLNVEKGEYVAIMGESGSGKTTLLNILAALDRPTSGSVYLNGKDLTKIPEKCWLLIEEIILGLSSRILTYSIIFQIRIIFFYRLSYRTLSQKRCFVYSNLYQDNWGSVRSWESTLTRSPVAKNKELQLLALSL